MSMACEQLSLLNFFNEKIDHSVKSLIRNGILYKNLEEINEIKLFGQNFKPNYYMK